MKAFVRVVGLFLVALVVIGLCLRVFVALTRGQAFYGQNYKMLDLPTYSTALTFGLILLIGVAWGVAWLYRRFRGGRR